MNTLKHCTDIELVLHFQDTQSNQVFGELYQRYYQKVFLYCLKITKNHMDAFDITQEVFIKVNAKLSGLKQPATFPSWLFRIARNQSMDQLNRLKRQKKCSLNEVIELAVESFDSEAILEKEQLFEQLEWAMTQISIEEQNMLTEKYIDNKSIIDLSEKYHLSESAIKMRLLRSRDRVKRLTIKRA